MYDDPMNEKTSYHHGDLRSSLLDAAAALLREQGEAGLSMRQLAARVGVSRTAPYHHFKDKQQLLCAVAEQGFKHYTQVLLLDSKQLSETRLRRFIRDYLDFAIDNIEYYDLMFGSRLWKSEGITDTLKREAHRSFRQYLEQIKTWQAEGAVAATLDPLRYAQVSWSTLHGMSRLLIDGVYLEREAIDPACDQAAAMFWHALQPG